MCCVRVVCRYCGTSRVSVWGCGGGVYVCPRSLTSSWTEVPLIPYFSLDLYDWGRLGRFRLTSGDSDPAESTDILSGVVRVC